MMMRNLLIPHLLRGYLGKIEHSHEGYSANTVSNQCG